jgi:Flp pilus assembly protein TadB
MNITKEQMEHLTSEQQETLASIELHRIKKRQRLIEEAKRHRVAWFFLLIPGLLQFATFFLVYKKQVSLGLALFIMGVALCLCFLIQIQAQNINRRIDALIELLETNQDDENRDA